MSTSTRNGLRRFRRLVPEPLQPTVRRAYLQLGTATSRLRMEPSFLVIGGQRCGTTTIFKSLSDHPQVARPPVEKGTDYYTLHYTRGTEWYRGHFATKAATRVRSVRNGGGAVAFEACTYYLFHPLAIERIAQDYPGIKLIAMLRDPVERAFSAYKHEFGRGFETEPDFERALDLEDSRMEGEIERIRLDPQYESIAHRHHAYTRRGQYAEQLTRVFSHFPREQVHIMESESFFENPQREFADLVAFLGLEPWAPSRIDQHNARPSTPMPAGARQRLREHYAPHDRRLEELLGRPARWTM